jgi:hypothetical protein
MFGYACCHFAACWHSERKSVEVLASYNPQLIAGLSEPLWLLHYDMNHFHIQSYDVRSASFVYLIK